MSQTEALSGLPLEELAALIAPQPKFRATQIFKWIASGACGFGEMGNLPLALRDELARRFSLRPPAAETRHAAGDGTVKLALRFCDGAAIEAVLLSDSGLKTASRKTACLSTQAGCPAGCVFCKTGSLGFLRNLDSAEIVEQFLRLNKAAEEMASQPEQPAARPISSIVVMGMGEPLLNLAELRKAVDVIASPAGLHFSRRKITVSTCGIADGIIGLADKGPAVRLALSLTCADEGLRRRLMPITAGQSLSSVKKALGYFQKRGGGRVTLELVLLGGINTSDEAALGVAKFAEGLDAAINLIPWNPVKGLAFEGKPLREPSPAEAAAFARRLEALGLAVTRRFRRGRGVMGACGQLGQLLIALDAVSACGSLS
ncbi:MAG: 23S rRNA (adenine(2503)-C(2))-methyltransferase RlmN [Treponema sp.]|jgi:23S rRNA (adenine2503-C2)-methyltransferase|nr:23S rRNA (adenine(2503)-C(2))-methyltransferase RlmN [Treponema sp.]